MPDYKGRLTRTFHTGNLVFSYSRRVNPGNGVFLTPQYESGGVSYSFTGAHRWNIGFDGEYDRYSSLTPSIGPYQGYRGGFGLTRDLVKNFHLTLRSDYRHFDVNYALFRRSQIRASLGVAWSPGEMPLALW